MTVTHLAIYTIQVFVTMDMDAIKARAAILQHIVSFRSTEDPRLWWIIDDESFEANNPKRKLPNQDKLHTSMTIFEWIGLSRTDLVKVLGSRK